MTTINDIIAETAIDNIGQEEVRGNLGFKDLDFERKMEAVGFESGQAWCAYFAELVWKLAYQRYDATQHELLDNLFSASAVNTFNNFKSNPSFHHSNIPEIGSLVVWRSYKNGKPHWTGHIGIVVSEENESDYIYTVEGNTNNNGSREGYKVAKKKRKVSYIKKQNGLNLMGFITPKI